MIEIYLRDSFSNLNHIRERSVYFGSPWNVKSTSVYWDKDSGVKAEVIDLNHQIKVIELSLFPYPYISSHFLFFSNTSGLPYHSKSIIGG